MGNSEREQEAAARNAVVRFPKSLQHTHRFLSSSGDGSEMDTNSLPERDKGAQACVNTRYLWRNEKAEQPCGYAPHTVCAQIRIGPEQPVMEAQAYASGGGGRLVKRHRRGGMDQAEDPRPRPPHVATEQFGSCLTWIGSLARSAS